MGQYLRDVRRLLQDDIRPQYFSRRWDRRIRAAGGYELEPDPHHVLAMVFVSGPGPIDRYRRLHPGTVS